MAGNFEQGNGETKEKQLTMLLTMMHILTAKNAHSQTYPCLLIEVWELLQKWKDPQQPRGRPVGSRATTGREDQVIHKTFLKIRGPNVGGAVDAPTVLDFEL